MAALLALSLSLGLDSLRVAAAIGLRPSRRYGLQLALAFGICDGLASLLGLLLGQAVVDTVAPGSQIVSAVALGVCGAWFLVARPDTPPLGRAMLLVPVALSLDNLAAGLALGSAGVPAITAVVLCVASAAMAGVGLGIGARLRDHLGTRLRGRLGRLSGVLLLAMAGAQGVGFR